MLEYLYMEWSKDQVDNPYIKDAISMTELDSSM